MLDELLRKLNSPNQRLREEALREVQMLPPDELVALVQAGAKYYQKRSRSGMALVGVFLATTYLYAFGRILEREKTAWPLWLIAITTIGAAVFLFTYLPRQMYDSLSKLLNEINDVRFLAPALTMLPYAVDFPAMSISLRKLIIRILRQVRADHATQITPEVKRQIPGLLLPIHSQEMRVAALKALGQVGDESAIPAVQRLKHEIAWRQMELLEAIAECLELLEANGNARRQAQTLLRASGPNVAAPDTLLRAAIAGNNSTAPEQLLRPN